MSTIIVLGLVLASALTCPAMMLIGRRRGKSMACCVPRRDAASSASAAELRQRQAALSEEIERRSSDNAHDPHSPSPAV